MLRRVLICMAAMALFLGACGGDDATPDGETTTVAGAGGGEQSGGSGDGDMIVPEVSDDDNVVTQLLAKVFGLPGSFVTQEQGACMSDELAPLFPTGTVPDDFTLTEELGDALDAAAITCGVDLGS